MTTDSETKQDCSGAAPAAQKKSYKAPELQVFGDVRALTQSTLGAGVQDGMGGAGMMHSAP